MYGQAHPIGYVEVQRAGIVSPGCELDLAAAVADVKLQATRDYPGLVPYGSRVETQMDGAGVQRWNLYMGFAPKVVSAEPLDPNDLGGANNSNLGDPARDNLMGSKEQKF